MTTSISCCFIRFLFDYSIWNTNVRRLGKNWKILCLNWWWKCDWINRIQKNVRCYVENTFPARREFTMLNSIYEIFISIPTNRRFEWIKNLLHGDIHAEWKGKINKISCRKCIIFECKASRDTNTQRTNQALSR